MKQYNHMKILILSILFILFGVAAALLVRTTFSTKDTPIVSPNANSSFW